MRILIATTYFISSPQFAWKLSLSLSLYIYMCMPSSFRISSECVPKNPKMDFFFNLLDLLWVIQKFLMAWMLEESDSNEGSNGKWVCVCVCV
jgi:hypothetical protein